MQVRTNIFSRFASGLGSWMTPMHHAALKNQESKHSNKWFPTFQFVLKLQHCSANYFPSVVFKILHPCSRWRPRSSWSSTEQRRASKDSMSRWKVQTKTHNLSSHELYLRYKVHFLRHPPRVCPAVPQQGDGSIPGERKNKPFCMAEAGQ